MNNDNKKYGDELFIYAMTLMEEQERKEEKQTQDKKEQEVIDNDK